MKALLLSLSLLSFSAMAANECADLGKCVEYVSKLTGKKYIFNGTILKGNLQSSSNTEINATNADTMFTYILDMNGYARVPTAVKDTYMIVEARDIRYQTLPVLEASKDSKPSIPETYDYYSFSYKFKNYSAGQLKETSNAFRPFMSRYGRIIENKATGTVYVNEVATKLAQAYDLMKTNDREWTKEEIAKMKEEEAKREKREEREARREKEEEKKEAKKV